MNSPDTCAGFPACFPALGRFKAGPIVALLMGALTFLPARAQLYTETSAIHGDPISGDDSFGITVAASGNTIVVGTTSAPPHGPFRCYVYTLTTHGWDLQQHLDFPTYDVAIDGDTLVGGGVVYVRSGASWTVQQTPIGLEHPRAALQGDTLVLGNPNDRTQDHGSVYVFVRSGSTWTQQAVFGPDAPTTSQMMGNSVALDGDTFIAGVNGSTTGAYVFVRSGTTWTRQTRLFLPTGNGADMKVALEGDTAAVSDPANDRVYIFTRSGTTWTLAQTLTMPATGGNNFGHKLSLNGGILAVGADTVFYLYSKTSSGWILAQTLVPPANGSGDYGYDGGAALANEGKLFVTGKPTNQLVHVFSVPPPPAPGSGWRDTDIGAVGVAGGSSITGDAGEVRGSGSDIWENADQFHFRSETLTGNGAIIARVTSAGSGNPWAKVGLMFREDVAPASRTVTAFVTPGDHLGLQARAATADSSTFVDGGWAGAPIWLMLSRTGDVFDAFRSDDGSHWTPIGSATVKMTATIHVGLAVCSHDNTVLNTGTYSGIELVGSTPPPPPPGTLTDSDLGTVGVAGTHSESGGVITIDAAGADIWNEADSGYFLHREITGDFDIRAHVTALANTNPWAKAGVMVRESLDANARNVFTLVTAGNAAGMQVRSATGAATTFSAGPWYNPPLWVRLVRTGNNFQSFISGDGATWQSVGTATVALPATLHAGLAVSSHVANTTTHATIEGLDFGD